MVKISLIIISILFSTLLLNCAKIERPSGGPLDKTSPIVLSTFPSANDIKVNKSIKSIEIELSEWVSKSSTLNSIFVSPTSPRMEIKIKGRKISLIPESDLLSNTSYIISYGTNISDMRGNKLENTYHLTFSTGDYIDSGFISGIIFDSSFATENSFNFTIALVKLNKIEFNPSEIEPLYITQSNKDGEFDFKNVSFGKYQIYAFKDSDNSWTLSNNEYSAIPTRNINISKKEPNDTINLSIALFDSSQARLKKAISLEGNKLLLTFDKQKIDTGMLFAIPIDSIIIDSQLNKSQRITFNFIKPISNTIILNTDTLKNLQNYTFYYINTKTSDTSKTIFKYYSIKDTTASKVMKVYPKFISNNDTINFIFSEPIIQNSILNGINIFDTLNNKINFIASFINPITMNLQIINPIDSSKYTLRMDADSLVDQNGNYSIDTNLIYDFLYNKTSYGSLSGKLENFTPNKQTIIKIISLNSTKVYNTLPKINGTFKINELEEGYYRFVVFKDINKNGIFDIGCLFPLKYTEKFQVLADSIFIRKNWETENINLILK